MYPDTLSALPLSQCDVALNLPDPLIYLSVIATLYFLYTSSTTSPSPSFHLHYPLYHLLNIHDTISTSSVPSIGPLHQDSIPGPLFPALLKPYYASCAQTTPLRYSTHLYSVVHFKTYTQEEPQSYPTPPPRHLPHALYSTSKNNTEE